MQTNTESGRRDPFIFTYYKKLPLKISMADQIRLRYSNGYDFQLFLKPQDDTTRWYHYNNQILNVLKIMKITVDEILDPCIWCFLSFEECGQ